MSNSPTSSPVVSVALVTKRDARIIRWVANWASLCAEMAWNLDLHERIRATLNRPEVQEELRKLNV